GEFGVADGLGLLSVAQREGDFKDHVPVQGDLEDAVAVGEVARRMVQGDRLAALPVVRPYLDDGLGHVLAVRPDVLDRGGTDPAGDAGQALHAGQALGDAAGDERLPLLAGLGPYPYTRVRRAGDALDAAGGDVHHRAGNPGVADDQVAAAAEDEQRF